MSRNVKWVCNLIDGYIKENISLWIPNAIANVIILFYGKYNTMFDSDILNYKYKLDFMELISTKLKRNIRLNRIYSGLNNGFTCKDFHLKCRNKGANIVLIKNEYQYIFGGYTSIPWESVQTRRHVKDASAFLFQINPFCKIFNQIENNNGRHAVRQYKINSEWMLGYGNGCNLWISNKCNINRDSGSQTGTTYSYPDGPQTLVGGPPIDDDIVYFGVKNMEVFQIFDINSS